MDPALPTVHRKQLRKHRSDLIRHVKVNDVLLEFLNFREVLTDDMVDAIKEQKTSRDRARRLVELLPWCGATVFSTFLEGLVLTDQTLLARGLVDQEPLPHPSIRHRRTQTGLKYRCPILYKRSVVGEERGSRTPTPATNCGGRL